MRRTLRCLGRAGLLVLAVVLIAMGVHPPGVAGDWGVQVNNDGFGLPNCNSTWTMAYFGDYLYAGSGLPGRLFRTDGSTVYGGERYEWYEVPLPTTFDTVGDFEISNISAMIAFDSPDGAYLYLAASGTDRSDGQYKNALFRSADGNDWRSIGVWNTVDQGQVTAMEQLGRHLYISDSLSMCLHRRLVDRVGASNESWH